jgi:predicted transposase/invertase (TIGR01784 family)
LGAVKEYLNIFRFYNQKNGLCFEDIPEEIYTLELPKVPASSDGSAGWSWMQFLRSRQKDEFEMVAVDNPEIRKAADTLYQLSADDLIKDEYERRQKAWRDRATDREGYFLDGMQQGRKDSTLETARKMKDDNLTVSQIAKYTGLTEQQINDL